MEGYVFAIVFDITPLRQAQYHLPDFRALQTTSPDRTNVMDLEGWNALFSVRSKLQASYLSEIAREVFIDLVTDDVVDSLLEAFGDAEYFPTGWLVLDRLQ